MNSFDLFKSERKFKFNISSSICIMCKLYMIVKTIIFASETKSLMPLHPCLFPFFKPLKLTAGLYEELHFHLFKLPHTEDKLPCYYFITECFPDLGNPERDLHSSGFLNI